MRAIARRVREKKESGAMNFDDINPLRMKRERRTSKKGPFAIQGREFIPGEVTTRRTELEGEMEERKTSGVTTPPLDDEVDMLGKRALEKQGENESRQLNRMVSEESSLFDLRISPFPTVNAANEFKGRTLDTIKIFVDLSASRINGKGGRKEPAKSISTSGHGRRRIGFLQKKQETQFF